MADKTQGLSWAAHWFKRMTVLENKIFDNKKLINKVQDKDLQLSLRQSRNKLDNITNTYHNYFVDFINNKVEPVNKCFYQYLLQLSIEIETALAKYQSDIRKAKKDLEN